MFVGWWRNRRFCSFDELLWNWQRRCHVASVLPKHICVLHIFMLGFSNCRRNDPRGPKHHSRVRGRVFWWSRLVPLFLTLVISFLAVCLWKCSYTQTTHKHSSTSIFALPQRKLCKNSMCNNASNASPHRTEYEASCGSSSKLECGCWHPDRLLWLYHAWKRATRCSHVSTLQTTLAINTPIISDSLWLSHEV